MPEILTFGKYGDEGKDNPLKNLWQFFQSQSRFIKMVIVSGLLIAVVAPFVTYQRFQMRQQASSGPLSLYFTQHGSTTPLTNLTLTEGQSITLDLYLKTETTNVSGFDITTGLTQNNTLNLVDPGITEASGAGNFNTLLFNTWTNGVWRFVKINTDVNKVNFGDFYLASIPFRAGSSGTGSLNFTNATITSPESTVALSVGKQTLAYAIVTPSPTPLPTVTSTPTPSPTPTNIPTPTFTPTPSPRPTVTPTPTPTPRPTNTPTPTSVPTLTPTLIPTPLPIVGDIDGNGCVGIQDFAIWVRAFQAGLNTGPADINHDGKIDILDFNIWYQTMLTGQHVCK